MIVNGQVTGGNSIITRVPFTVPDQATARQMDQLQTEVASLKFRLEAAEQQATYAMMKVTELELAVKTLMKAQLGLDDE